MSMNRSCLDHCFHAALFILSTIATILHYLYRFYYHHDAMITTVVYYDGRCHPYMDTIHRYVQSMIRGYIHCQYAYQMFRHIQERTGIRSYLLSQLRRVSRRFIRTCRKAILKMTHPQQWWRLLITMIRMTNRLWYWMYHSTTMVLVLLMAITSWLVGGTRNTKMSCSTDHGSVSTSSVGTSRWTSIATSTTTTKFQSQYNKHHRE
jgi:hypothetical protein